MTAIYKMNRSVMEPYAILRREIRTIVAQAHVDKLRERQIRQKIVEFAMLNSRSAFVLWAAVTHDVFFSVAPVLKRLPYTVELDGKRLEVEFQMPNFPCSYLQARVVRSGSGSQNFRRLKFFCTEQVGDFQVRVFKTSAEAWSSRGEPHCHDPSDGRHM